MKIFICSNENQLISAKVAKQSILNRSNYSESDIDILLESSVPMIKYFHSKPYLRGGRLTHSDKNDMQSFTLLRFYIPQKMNYEGEALVIDPDIFLIQSGLEDIEKLSLETHSIYARQGIQKNSWGSSVMLLSCKDFKHWSLESLINRLHQAEIDYDDLINLRLENSIGTLESKWNEFDDIKKDTILLHTTERLTQPWRAGLKLNSSIKPFLKFIPKKPIYKIFGRDLTLGKEHPNDQITEFFFKELFSCISNNLISMQEIELAVKNKFLRQDIVEKLHAYNQD